MHITNIIREIEYNISLIRRVRGFEKTQKTYRFKHLTRLVPHIVSLLDDAPDYNLTSTKISRILLLLSFRWKNSKWYLKKIRTVEIPNLEPKTAMVNTRKIFKVSNLMPNEQRQIYEMWP